MNTKTKFICWDLENTKVTGKVKVTGVLLHWDVQNMPMLNIHPSWAILFALFTPGGTTLTICVYMCVREFLEKGAFFKARLRSEQIFFA